MDKDQQLCITDFTPVDEQATLAFCHKIFEEKEWPLEFMDRSISEAFNQPGDVFLIVKQNKAIVGCGGLKKLSDDDALMTRFFIDEQQRGTGLASKLFEALVHRARELKYSSIVLDVAHDNPRAIRFYEKQGMVPFRPAYHPRWMKSAPGEDKYVKYLKKNL